MIKQLKTLLFTLLLTGGFVALTHAEEITLPASSLPEASLSDTETLPIAEQIQLLKKTAIDLNRDLFILEEDLLFPANTQITVFLSVDVGTFFELDAVELLIDDEIVTSYLYTKRQREALNKGGLQRLYIGNLKTGQHEITAFFTGKGPKDEDHKRAATLVFEKGTDAKPLELQIRDSSQKYQAAFNIVEWKTTD